MEDFDLIFQYTRKEAIKDGVLVDVSPTAKKIGFIIPVAMTEALYAKCGSIGDPEENAVEARIFITLLEFFKTIKTHSPKEPVLILKCPFRFLPEEQMFDIKCIIGPGDEGEPVLTLMLIHED